MTFRKLTSRQVFEELVVFHCELEEDCLSSEDEYLTSSSSDSDDGGKCEQLF